MAGRLQKPHSEVALLTGNFLDFRKGQNFDV